MATKNNSKSKAKTNTKGLGIIVFVLVMFFVVAFLNYLSNYKFENGKWVARAGVASVAGIQIDDSKAKTLTLRVKVPSGMDGVQFRVCRFEHVMWLGQMYQTASGIKQVGGLKGGKTYYVQVRAYKSSGLNRKVFGSWSGVTGRRVREARK